MSQDVTAGLTCDFDARDPAGVDGIFTILLRPDAQAWVYGYIRNLSNLYVVEGLS